MKDKLEDAAFRAGYEAALEAVESRRALIEAERAARAQGDAEPRTVRLALRRAVKHAQKHPPR
jgi:hypothetical protein